jgi:hypothetical protein
MDAPMSLPGERHWFRRRVREEARATWNAECGWLWRVAWLALVVYAAFTPVLGFEHPAFVLMCAVAFWVPAWLGADLLATRFSRNPDPLREWHPAEFGARAAGRLGPFLLAEAGWLAVYCARSLFDALNRPRGFGSPLADVGYSNIGTFWVAWILVFIASGLPYFAGAALMSATARRPRAVLVMPVVVFAGSFAVMLLLGVLTGGPSVPASLSDWLSLLIQTPMLNYHVGFTSALLLSQWAGHPATWPGPDNLAQVCWLGTGAFLFYTVVFGLAAWYVAERRYLRHAGAARPGSEAPVPEPQPAPEGLPA